MVQNNHFNQFSERSPKKRLSDDCLIMFSKFSTVPALSSTVFSRQYYRQLSRSWILSACKVVSTHYGNSSIMWSKNDKMATISLCLMRANACRKSASKVIKHVAHSKLFHINRTHHPIHRRIPKKKLQFHYRSRQIIPTNSLVDQSKLVSILTMNRNSSLKK